MSSKTDLKTAAAKSGGFPALLKQMEPQIALALPKHMTADRVLRLVLTEFRKNPRLGQCAPQTIGGAIVWLSQMGLEIGVLGQAYLVPYFNTKSGQLECQGIPGWQGHVELVNRAGRASIWSGAVYDGDFFEYELGTKPFVKHKQGDNHGIGNLLYTYSVGWVKGGEFPTIEVFSQARLVKHRDKNNKVGDKHYSYNNWEMYARKVPLLQVAKYMPKSPEYQGALDAEDNAEQGVTIDLDAFSMDFTDGAGGGDQQPEPTENEQQQRGRGKRAADKDKPAAQAEPEAERAGSKSTTTVGQKMAEAPADDSKSGPQFTMSDFLTAIMDAKEEEDLDNVLDLSRSMENPKNREAIKTMVENKRAQLKTTTGGGNPPTME